MADIVPYGGFDMTEYPQAPSFVPAITRPGLAVGIHILLHPESVEEVAAKFERWFARRNEVTVVDVGTSNKTGIGFVILEWLECDVDPLFISILDDEESIADYSLYGRQLEG